ncbi:hypothetical protein J6590_038348 [Homalodisca vitripennis]|nr:hypothetical protein J6590_038348 [Homalodisca vitripennis]
MATISLNISGNQKLYRPCLLLGIVRRIGRISQWLPVFVSPLSSCYWVLSGILTGYHSGYQYLSHHCLRVIRYCPAYRPDITVVTSICLTTVFVLLGIVLHIDRITQWLPVFVRNCALVKTGTHITAPCPTRESAECRCRLGSVTVRPHISVYSPSATTSLFILDLEHVSFEFEVTDT